MLDRLDLGASIKSELAFHSDLLPKQVSDAAAADNPSVHEKVIRQTLLTEDVGTEAPVVTAQKSRFGRRPAAALTLVQRVVFRAVVDLLEEWLVPQRDPTDYAEFQEGPTTEDTGFVVITDLAHYYATLPLPALQRELMARSGEWQSVQWLGEFLTGVSPSIGGLPQGNSASDRLGDTYADALARRLRRRGISSWRYADDFRFVTKTYGSAVDALETFSEEARAMGLLVNDNKTWITSISQYRSRLEQPRRAFTGAWQSKRDELTLVNPYDWSESPPEDAAVWEELAIEELASWSEVADSLMTSPAEMREERLDLSRVLGLLTVFKSPQALTYIPALLRVEPQLTPRIRRYLGVLLGENESDVLETLADVVAESGLTNWQSIWLTELLSFDLGNGGAAADLKEWTTRNFLAGHQVLRAYAGWASASQGVLSLDQWRLWALDAQAPFSQSFIHASLGAVEPSEADSVSSKAVGEDLMVEWGKNHFVPF